MGTIRRFGLPLFLASGAASFAAHGQGAPSAASLEGVSGCSLQGNDVFISPGQGAEQRRYKYPWDASIDALCNAKGFAIAAPPRPPEPARPAATTAAPQAPAAPPAPANASGAFPEGATALQPADLTKLLSGQAFRISAGGRIQYDAGGNAYFNSGGGFNMSGTWTVDGSAVCYTWRSTAVANGCNEVRILGSQIYARRVNGEIIKLEK